MTNSDGSDTVDTSTALAQQRTELALERTLLAWVRTAFAFISASVALNRLLLSKAARDYFVEPHWKQTAWIVSVVLSISTTLLLCIATVHYVQQCRRIELITDHPHRIAWPSILASVLVIVIGVTASVLLTAEEL